MNQQQVAEHDQELIAREEQAAEQLEHFREVGLQQQVFVVIAVLTDILHELRKLTAALPPPK